LVTLSTTKYGICRIARQWPQRYLSSQLDALEQQPTLNSAIGSRSTVLRWKVYLA